MKRVWCLYRVSTKKQVNVDDDIPMQREACHSFVSKKQDWIITKELYEKGVSGWRKKANERDALVEIKKGAIDGELDILLVFMFDRLGRREDETPLIVHFLHENGVDVWSVQEGRRTIESHTDKLINYIHFWQSDGESQKTSARVRESKKHLSKQGYFQGGPPPIGYKMVETDKVHWKYKDKFLKELIPFEEEAELVQLIFHLYVHRKMGYRKIVDYLNGEGYRSRNGQPFSVSTIQKILKNPIYIGRKNYHSFDGEITSQPYNEKLRIISDDLFFKAQEIRERKREALRGKNKEGVLHPGKLLFTGFAYCRYCQGKLTGNYLYKKQKRDGKVYTHPIYRYQCPANKGTANHEQTIWGAKKYEKMIIEQIKELLKRMDIGAFIDKSLVEAKRKRKRNHLSKLEKEKEKYLKQKEKLHMEIMKSMINESPFTKKQLSELLEHLQGKMKETEQFIKRVRAQLNEDGEKNRREDFLSWEEKFDNCDPQLKKAILANLIHKIYFSKNEIHIEVHLAMRDVINNRLQ